ncbi:hypothetical protein T265_06234 [Opisthorchis viverrini]|uniref:Uncharacterized protein n=1 Tax=Opisthorchis viverrini TaxID=6198 RepID=A0A074ZH28_OPIVI|nr:hypothetical protein T265_06234 [Opisthorchis viverrini]KER26513.1 hypothetical protein T265_06234 [Opisthorchis viverrini]
MSATDCAIGPFPPMSLTTGHTLSTSRSFCEADGLLICGVHVPTNATCEAPDQRCGDTDGQTLTSFHKPNHAGELVRLFKIVCIWEGSEPVERIVLSFTTGRGELRRELLVHSYAPTGVRIQHIVSSCYSFEHRKTGKCNIQPSLGGKAMFSLFGSRVATH